MNHQQLHELALSLFEKKKLLTHLHQEIADNFYPERADFAFQRELGDSFAGHLETSYPLLVRRDLSDQIGGMLRPEGQPWFSVVPTDPEREVDHEGRQWLEFVTRVQRRAMYDRSAMLKRALKEGDNDYVTFGNTAVSAELVFSDSEGWHLLHRCWHLRDMAWQESKYGQVGNRFRRWTVAARTLHGLFGDKVHPSVARNAKAPGAKALTDVDVMHMVVEADLVDGNESKNRRKWPWCSIFYDATNRHTIEETYTFSPYYVIARWQTVSGGQYAYSPATIVGLPDARMIQAMSRTLLEAGEKAANPPMVATAEVVRSDVAIYAGGITWVDRDYDERLGDALRPLTQDYRGIPVGMDMLRDARQVIHACFYLNKLTLPQSGGDMTAYEVGQRVQEYIRNALPLFAPMEEDYNGQVCDLDFDLLFHGGAFGPAAMIPRSLQGERMGFSFRSPLHDAIESQATQKFLEMGQLLATALQMDKTTAAIPDAVTAFRDALAGAQIPAKWQRSPIAVRQMADQQAEADAQTAALEQLVPASEAAVNFGKASRDAAETGIVA